MSYHPGPQQFLVHPVCHFSDGGFAWVPWWCPGCDRCLLAHNVWRPHKRLFLSTLGGLILITECFHVIYLVSSMFITLLDTVLKTLQEIEFLVFTYHDDWLLVVLPRDCLVEALVCFFLWLQALMVSNLGNVPLSQHIFFYWFGVGHFSVSRKSWPWQPEWVYRGR